MSNTYAHTPFWVRYSQPEACFAVHDHTDGPCDLPSLHDFFQKVRSENGYFAWRDTSCTWEVDFFSIPRICSCELCTMSLHYKQQRKDERRETKESLRRQVCEYNQDMREGTFDDVM